MSAAAATMQATAEVPRRPPHLAYGDREAILDEIASLAGAVGLHVEIAQKYAQIDHIEGLDLSIRDARSCFVKLIEFRKALSDA